MQPNGHAHPPLIGSRKDRFEVRPDEDGEAVYICRVPTVDDRARFFAAVERRGGRRLGVFGLLDELEAAVRRIFAEEAEAGADEEAGSLERWTAMIAAQRQRYSAFRDLVLDEASWWNDESIPAEDKLGRKAEEYDAGEDLVALEREVAKFDRGYADALEANALWPDLAASQAVRMFVVGWSGIDLPGRKPSKLNGYAVSDETLMAMPALHRVAVRDAITERMEPSGARLKNSRRPSSDTLSATAPSDTPSDSPPNAPLQ